MLLQVSVLKKIIEYLDYDNLMSMMSVKKMFREDFTRNPSDEQKHYFRIFKN